MWRPRSPLGPTVLSVTWYQGLKRLSDFYEIWCSSSLKTLVEKAQIS